MCEWVHAVTRTGNDGDEEPALWENDIIKIKCAAEPHHPGKLVSIGHWVTSHVMRSANPLLRSCLPGWL